jgi:hypothetical protein
MIRRPGRTSRRLSPCLIFIGPEHAQNHFPKDEVDIVGISKEKLFELLELEVTYWGKNVMGASLYWAVKDEGYERVSAKLVISYHHKFGFLLFHVSNDDPPMYMLAVDGRRAAPTPVEMDFQTPFFYPSNAFHSVSIAKQIVSAFVDSRGNASDRVGWIATDRDFSNPDDWKTLPSVTQK